MEDSGEIAVRGGGFSLARDDCPRLTGAMTDDLKPSRDIAVLLGMLQRAGLSQVLVFDLTQSEIGIPVVRVIVPGLEGYRSDFYAPGSRSHSFTEAVRMRMADAGGTA